MRFREFLRCEFKRRRDAQPNYSLRRFGRFLNVHHTTLGRLLAGSRPMPERAIRRLGSRLGLSNDALVTALALEHEEALVEAVLLPKFRPDSRWIATMTGIPVDKVNVSLQGLLRSGRLRMISPVKWKVARKTT